VELRLTSLDVEALAALLARAGAHVTPESVRTDIAAGAPTNADGTVNLIHYTAWLVRELSNRGD
jgi:hypothetical protein